MAKHFQFHRFFSYLQRGFFPISNFAIIKETPSVLYNCKDGLSPSLHNVLCNVSNENLIEGRKGNNKSRADWKMILSFFKWPPKRFADNLHLSWVTLTLHTMGPNIIWNHNWIFTLLHWKCKKRGSETIHSIFEQFQTFLTVSVKLNKAGFSLWETLHR